MGKRELRFGLTAKDGNAAQEVVQALRAAGIDIYSHSGEPDDGRYWLGVVLTVEEPAKSAPAQSPNAKPQPGIVFGGYGVDKGAAAMKAIADAAVAPAATPTSPDRVTLLGPSGRERYTAVSGLDGRNVLVDWWDMLHLFSRDDGTCVESTSGIMRGWRIAPEDLPRFRGSKAMGEVAK